MTDELAFQRSNMELFLTDSAAIYSIQSVDDNRGGETQAYTLFSTLPCRVTRPTVQIGETDNGLQPKTEERWDIAFSATTIETNNWRILKNWKITVRGIDYNVLDGGEEQTDPMLYHVAVERLT